MASRSRKRSRSRSRSRSPQRRTEVSTKGGSQREESGTRPSAGAAGNPGAGGATNDTGGRASRFGGFGAGPGPGPGGAAEEEVDPLDAFMSGMQGQLQQDLSAAATSTGRAEETRKMTPADRAHVARANRQLHFRRKEEFAVSRGAER
eukprot:TRINITY_DN10510_c0_g4_i1.p3 TRINITY_DN10510_c0_g4~~TRINITY_DN10510_c0_g4_i1.p3  ORF type:complete len:172 (+),score=40.51 TRINITY_DN10510_c0_g4_i1:73-516(+)